MTVDVLHVVQPVDGGAARVVALLAAAQQAAGLEVAVACPPSGELPDDVRGAGVRLHPWPASRAPGPGVVAEARSLAAIVREADPRVVHLHSAKAGLAGRLAVRGRRPTVFQPHAWSFEAVSGPMRSAARAWERAARRWTSLLVCVSEAERATGAAAGCLPASTAVVPNGVPVASFAAAGAAGRRAARAALGLADVPTAVVVGRLARQKGQDVAVRAWPSVRGAVPAAQLVLVGAGPDEAALRAAAGPGCTLAGPASDVSRWYAAADVVLLPSRWEGMPLVLLEALASGRSVVASDVAGVRESLPDDAGAVVPVEDADALAAAVVVRLSDPERAEAEGRRGRRHVEEHHDVRHAAAATTAAYGRVVAPWPPR